MRRGFWIAFWGVLTAVVWRGALLPASVRNLRLNGVSGDGPAYARFSWGYGAGARPQSIIFDLSLGAGASGSITTDGEATEAEVPVGGAAAGPHAICATATYRILGVVRTREYRFTGGL
ncbi:hypothetical protein K2Z83_00410 [Oscillochloris sp. ZM17-4]|uniref:hypothetical protein n=1 Tax=Oscillochloris sp. ZM17-4 TaxID=2866714 RepID=UPI001C731316|nr:hypothetical protein [Oscillochloris sp. ZM17-4]MBX0326156.1 hypothetical protein [Oscillochloris sp. ZM17-4]